MHKQMLFDFNTTTKLNNWFITNDDVMGGVSTSNLVLNANGNGVFSGVVSTKNNGGFSMVRYQDTVSCEGYENIVLRVKGDGKKYQFRLKSNRNERFWFVQQFETTTDWLTIELPLRLFTPSFRGRVLDRSNFSESKVQEIAFLIGNKRDEEFKLIIDKIYFN